MVEFDDASQAGTPGLIGGAREHPARRQFEGMLPGAAAVGSGLVLDSRRAVSKQQDIVVFEQQLCPVFSVDGTPEATYYPVEGVIAVGEVKSRRGTVELEDAFEKIASVKRLRPHSVATDNGLGPLASYRHYGTGVAFAATQESGYDQDGKALDQVFGFILCGGFGLQPETLVARARELWARTPPPHGPNILVSLNDGFVQPCHLG